MNAKNIVLIICAVAAVAAVAGSYLIWGVPGDLKAEDWRNAILIVGGLTAGIIATWRAYVADEQAKTESKKANIAEQIQITDRFARAIEQLNNEHIYMRIGAVHALERIGHDSEDDVLAVLRLLASFVRGQSPAKNKSVHFELPPDAKEGLDVIVRLTSHYKEFLKDDSFRLDLSASNLASFPVANQGYFCGFDFRGSTIMYQVFPQANFGKASFSDANLTNTRFWKCNFVRAWFGGAILDSAWFYDADMSKATLLGATCNNTDFSTAKNLTTEMLKDIVYDAETPPRVPLGVTLPPPRESKTVLGNPGIA